MIYDEIKVLKQSEKSTVRLVKEQGGESMLIRKTLQGQHAVYQILQEIKHPYLPKVYEVSDDNDQTTILEEYIEGQTAGSAALTEKQCRTIIFV